jgi:hypothetical protein
MPGDGWQELPHEWQQARGVIVERFDNLRNSLGRVEGTLINIQWTMVGGFCIAIIIEIAKGFIFWNHPGR